MMSWKLEFHLSYNGNFLGVYFEYQLSNIKVSKNILGRNFNRFSYLYYSSLEIWARNHPNFCSFSDAKTGQPHERLKMIPPSSVVLHFEKLLPIIRDLSGLIYPYLYLYSIFVGKNPKLPRWCFVAINKGSFRFTQSNLDTKDSMFHESLWFLVENTWLFRVRKPFPRVSSGILMGCHSPIICGAAGFTDTDTRKGFIGGDLKFGPSTIDQRTDEDGVYLG